MPRTMLLPAVLLTVTLTACASPVGTTAQAGRTVTLHADDTGRAVQLHTGDELVLELGRPSGSVGSATWRLTTYPAKGLRLATSDRAVGRFHLQAVGPTSGVLRASAEACPKLEVCPDSQGASFSVRVRVTGS